MTQQTETIYAFIDSQNLNLGVRSDGVIKGKKVHSGWKLDFSRFHVYLRDKFHVSKAFLFIGKKPGEEALHSFLERTGYEVIYKPTVPQRNGETKGNVDAELVLHSMLELANYDRAIIVSGDGDFLCLIDYLVSIGKLSHILIPNRYSYSSLLRKHAKNMMYVSDWKSKLEYKTKREG